MAITKFIEFLDDTVLPADDLNQSFDKIINNALQLVSPWTGNMAADGNALTLDSDGDTSISAITDDVIELVLGGATLIRFDGSTPSAVNGWRFRATATATAPSIEVTGNPNQNLDLVPSGTGVLQHKGTDLTYDSDLLRTLEARS